MSYLSRQVSPLNIYIIIKSLKIQHSSFSRRNHLFLAQSCPFWQKNTQEREELDTFFEELDTLYSLFVLILREILTMSLTFILF